MKHQRIAMPDYSRDLVVSPSWVVAIPFFVLGMVFSLWYVDAYFAGDVISYAKFYDALYGMPHQYWARLQRVHLGSAEPLYRYIVGVGAYNGWGRTLYLSVWNGVVVGAVGYALVKHRCSLIFSMLVLTNFYLLVLLGSAERLKFAYLVLVLAFIVDNRNLKFVLAATSPFFHTQAMIQFASGFGYYVMANLQRLFQTPAKTFFFALGATASIGVVAYLFFGAVGQSVESKSAFYADLSGGISEAVQWVLLLVVGLAVFKEKPAFFVGMLPMGVLTILFGNRINVATFALFAALAILQRKTNNPVVLSVMAYMSLKSIPFLMDVSQFGDGFAGE